MRQKQKNVRYIALRPGYIGLVAFWGIFRPKRVRGHSRNCALSMVVVYMIKGYMKHAQLLVRVTSILYHIFWICKDLFAGKISQIHGFYRPICYATLWGRISESRRINRTALTYSMVVVYMIKGYMKHAQSLVRVTNILYHIFRICKDFFIKKISQIHRILRADILCNFTG